MIMRVQYSKKRSHCTDETGFCNVEHGLCRIVTYSLISKLYSYVTCKIRWKTISMERESD